MYLNIHIKFQLKQKTLIDQKKVVCVVNRDILEIQFLIYTMVSY